MELDSDMPNVITDKSRATRRGWNLSQGRGGSKAVAEVPGGRAQEQKEKEK